MQLISRLKQNSNFTNAEIDLANFILQNIETVTKMTIQDLSDNSFVSRPTIIRFYKKLGYDTYFDFRIQLESELKIYNKKLVDSNKPFNESDSYLNIADTISSLTKQIVDSWYNLLDENTLKSVVETLYNSNRIFIYALGDCYIGAESFIYKLTKIDCYAYMLNNYSYSLVNLHNIKETDCILILSTTGKTLTLESKTIRLICESRAKTILITSMNSYDFSHKFDYILNIFHGEDKILKIGSLASQVSIIYILNVLYSCLYEIDYNKNNERIENYSDYLRNKNII